MLRHKNYLLTVLFAVYVFSNIDGVALGLVLQDIKRDLSLTDTQLGVLTGIAFALMYSIVGIPIARWADRGDRVAILSLSAVVWSVLVAACGMATNFVQLLLLRVGVGIGEAGCFPASLSLIADYFNRAERVRANSVFVMSAGAIYLVGYGAGGWLNELYGWRVMFMMLGMPGLVVAALAWFTLREPRFESSCDHDAVGRFGFAARFALNTKVGGSTPPRLREIGLTLWSNATLRHVLLFWSVWTFFGSGISLWQPAFFVRSHELSTGEVGTWFAVTYGLGSTLGPFLGGAWASRYARNNERRQLMVVAGVCCGLMILSPFIYLVPNHYLAFGLLGLYAVGVTVFFGPMWAIILTLVPESMRAAVTAIFALLASLIGRGLGPLAMGALSDAFRAQFGEDSLRYALLALSPGFLWAAWHLYRASKSVMHDLAAMHEAPDWPRSDPHGVRISPGVSV